MLTLASAFQPPLVFADFCRRNSIYSGAGCLAQRFAIRAAPQAEQTTLTTKIGEKRKKSW